MIFKDYYKILGLDTNKVDFESIKLAYRDQAKKYHPDVNKGNILAEERFKDINEAYNVLSNHSSRRKYDRMWYSHIGRKKIKADKNKEKRTISRKDFFKMLFGIEEKNNKEEKKSTQNIRNKINGEDVETEISISIYEGFFGTKKKIALRTIKGKMKNFEINIPAGIRSGEKIKLLGQGKVSPNGGKNGDLLIKILLKDDKQYKLLGSDIYMDLNISPCEAVLGTKLNVNAIDETIGVYIPKLIETGEEIHIKNKGYRDSMGGRGDFIIKIKIMIPKNISQDEINLYKEIRKISKFNPREI